MSHILTQNRKAYDHCPTCKTARLTSSLGCATIISQQRSVTNNVDSSTIRHRHSISRCQLKLPHYTSFQYSGNHRLRHKRSGLGHQWHCFAVTLL